MNDVDTYFTLLQQREENCQDHHDIGGSDLLLLNIKQLNDHGDAAN